MRADGPADLGRVFFVAEFATAVAGWALGINPFDQPNVQEAKDNTQRVLDEGSPELDAGRRRGAAGERRPAPLRGDHGLPALLRRRSRRAPRGCASGSSAEHGVATTFGYGPRFLHSTGQFHKGGPAVGAFVQIVDDPEGDLEVPGEPYTFGTLIRAQADGDLQTLRSHGLDAVRAGKEIL